VTLIQNFQSLSQDQRFLRTSVLGDLYQEEIRFLDFDVAHVREGISNNIVVYLTVRILTENLPSGTTWKFSESTFKKTGRLSGSKFVSQSKDDSAREIAQVIENLAYQISPYLYEVDPRIGRDIGENPFPESPLFDPTLEIRRPAHNASVYWKARAEDPSPGPDAYEAQDSDRCAFCSESVIWAPSPEEILWGGGNLGWVHQICAPWI